MNLNPVGFPSVRLRRLRQTSALRALMQETRLHAGDLIAPFFIREQGPTKRLQALPAHPQWSLRDGLVEMENFLRSGGKTILLFGIPAKKDPLAQEAYNPKGIVQQTLRAVKKQFGSDLVVAADLCFCEYTNHGHCGVLTRRKNGKHRQAATVDNDATLKIIAQTAISLAAAGADIVAPSGMMDGQVKTIREAMDSQGFKHNIILSYAAKYASSLYGPFRELAQSTPSFGDRKTYQMNPAQARMALREMELDFNEGADILMVKPAGFYLDILARARQRFNCPLAAYQVSGEAWMIEAYVKAGMAQREDVILESTLAIKRAGADLVISYFAQDLLQILKAV